MNKVLLISIGCVLIAAALAVVVFMYLRTTTPAPGAPVAEVPSFPSGGGSTTVTPGEPTPARISVPLRSGESMSVNDFVHNGETAADPQNVGTYYLAGSIGYCLEDGTCPSGAKTESFSITYTESDHSFTVSLLSEPLKTARVDAEAFLASRLGVEKKALCTINVYVGTPAFVNATFAGTNLGFPSCAGAVLLP